MYCIYCGKELPDDAKFCLSCGAKTEMDFSFENLIRLSQNPKKEKVFDFGVSSNDVKRSTVNTWLQNKKIVISSFSIDMSGGMANPYRHKPVARSCKIEYVESEMSPYLYQMDYMINRSVVRPNYNSSDRDLEMWLQRHPDCQILYKQRAWTRNRHTVLITYFLYVQKRK